MIVLVKYIDLGFLRLIYSLQMISKYVPAPDHPLNKYHPIAESSWWSLIYSISNALLDYLQPYFLHVEGVAPAFVLGLQKAAGRCHLWY